jgi:ribose transport system ATP-binding protein
MAENKVLTEGQSLAAPAQTADSLHVVDAHLAYGKVVALDGANLHARAGEVHGLLGENGAGKSTLIKILSGVVAPDSGTVSLGVEPLRLGHPSFAEVAGISTVYQELSLIPTMTGAENLALGRPLSWRARLTWHGLETYARGILRENGAPPIDVGRPVHSLAFAERQILEIVRALSVPHRVLIFDEATSALPPDQSRWALKLARNAADKGVIVLFVTHRLQEIRDVCDTVSILRGGVTVTSGRIDEFTDDQLVAHMLGRRLERLYPKRTHVPSDETALEIRDWTVGGHVGPISLRVQRGEILGLAGLEGHGQRELLLGLAGDLPSKGTMLLDGKAYRPHTPGSAIKSGVALVPEDRQREGLLLSQSVRFNVTLATLASRAHHGGWIDDRRERAEAVAVTSELGLPGRRLDNSVSQLSGGMQQKVVLGKALLAKPRLLLLYDCTRGVDVGTKAQIFEIMYRLASDGVSIVFYSSEFAEVVNMSDRIAVMVEGRVKKILEKGTLSEAEILRVAIGAGALTSDAN